MMISSHHWAQVSVYDCSLNPIVSQTDIENAIYEYERQCIVFEEDESYIFTGNLNKKVTAVESIHLEKNFHTGNFNTTSRLWLNINNKGNYDVLVMNYPDLNSVYKNKKLELGLKLDKALKKRINAFIYPNQFPSGATPLNPFLEWELDIEFTFTHTSGLERKVDAFYYKEFERDLDNTKDWIDQMTEYAMRVRFAPTLKGEWTAKAKISVEGSVYAELPAFKFNVVESGGSGFVKTHVNRRNFERDGRIVYPVGHNLFSPYSNHGVKVNPWDEGSSPTNTHKAAPPSAWDNYLKDIDSFGKQGGRFIRTIQTPSSSLIEFEHRGNYNNRLHYAWEQDRLLELCEQHDILIQFNLMLHTPFMKYGDFYHSIWDFGHWQTYDKTVTFFYDLNDQYPAYGYNSDPSNPNSEPIDMLNNEEDLQYHEQRTRYYISRYGYSTQIYEFEILSEPFHINEQWKESTEGNGSANNITPEVEATIYNYHNRIAKYIKNHLKHTDHLLGMNMTTHHFNDSQPSQYDMDTSPEIPEIDVIGFNKYYSDPAELIKEKEEGNNNAVFYGEIEKSLYKIIRFLNGWYGKPVQLSEGGHTYNPCGNYVGHYKDVATLGFTGLAGFFMWNGYQHGDGQFDERTLWKSTIRAQQHMNGDDVVNSLSNNNGDWIQGREKQKGYAILNQAEKKDVKEHQYYVANNRDYANGYLYNRKYNLYMEWQQNGGPTAPANHTCIEGLAGQSPEYEEWIYDYPHLYNWPYIPIVWDDKKMKIHGLRKYQWYTIDYFSVLEDGNYIYSKCVKTNGWGELNLKHDFLFATGNSILWYNVYKSSCNESKKGELEKRTIRNEISSVNLTIHPNPSKGEFELNFETPSLDTYNVTIINVYGQEIMSKTYKGNSCKISLLNQPKGVYFVKVHSAEFEVVKKVIIGNATY